jgi:DNA-binding SARP family transcriptional activator
MGEVAAREWDAPVYYGVLGGFRCLQGEREVPEAAWGSPEAARLLRLLVVRAPDPVASASVCAAIWPQLESDEAEQQLRRAIAQLRSVLEPPAGPQRLEESEAGLRLLLRPADQLDSRRFEAGATEALAAEGPARDRLLRQARDLWGGEPLLEDRDQPWAIEFRERLQATHDALAHAWTSPAFVDI